MKHLQLHTLILLAVFLHSGYCSGCNGRCVPLFVSVGEEATIKCPIPDGDQDGVYMYIQKGNENEEEVLYYYKGGQLTLEDPFAGRVKTNKNFSDFSVFITNVSVHDGGVYWCKFNKNNKFTFSERTCLLVQSGIIQIFTQEKDWTTSIYLTVIGGLLFIILVMTVVLVKCCCSRRNYTPKQQPCNSEYEVMRGYTSKALLNPAYESSQRRVHSDCR